MRKQQTVTTQENSSNETLRERFANEQSKEVAMPETRSVKVYYKSCCGCGCSTYEYQMDVPFDSTIQNGDFVNDIPDGAEFLGEI